MSKTIVERKTDKPLPEWMVGPSTEANQARRIEVLVKKFQLDEKDCLTTAENGVKTATLLLLKNWATFSFDGSYERTTLIKHSIRLKEGQKPINQQYRPINPALEGDLRKQINNWLTHKVIETSHSPWNFGLVNAPKKNGKVRWCVDFCSINASWVVDTHPIGNIEDNLARLSRSKIYSALYCTGAFHAIDLEDEDKEKTSFATPWGSFQFTQLPFGLCGGPSTYARLVNLVRDGIPYDVALQYLDNTVIHTATLPDTLSAMDKVLGAM
jgi:hypothetical protein